MQHQRFRVHAALAVAAVVIACNSDTTVAPSVVTALTATVASSAQTGTVGTTIATPLTVVVTDQNGATMQGVTVTFTVSAGGGTLSATAVTSDSAGEASTSLTLGTVAGGNLVTASAGNGAEASFSAIGVADAPATLAKIVGDSMTVVTGSAAQSLTVRAIDKYGNAVAGATTTWTTSSGGVLSSAQAVTDADGYATITITVQQQGAIHVTVAVADEPTVTTTFTLIGT
jgi:adhesin/invasin